VKSALGSISILTLLAATSLGQTSLIVNGKTANNNSTVVEIPRGTVMVVTVANAQASGRPYGLFAALQRTAANTGWYLDDDGAGKLPFPVLTGIPTSSIETAFSTDVFPDRPGSPQIRLSNGGVASLTFFIPATFALGSYFLQAAVVPTGSSVPIASNGVEIDIVDPEQSARLLVSFGSVVDNVGFGTLSFSTGPGSGTFTAHPTLDHVRVDDIGLSALTYWHDDSAATDSGPQTANRARTIEVNADLLPALDNDNHEYARIRLPSAPGGIPERDLLRVYDVDAGQGLFMIINHGTNPNTSEDFFAIDETRVSNVANLWKANVAVNREGTRMLAVQTIASIDRVFLVAIDGSLPFAGGLNGVVELTPTGTVTVPSRSMVFTQDNAFFVAIATGTEPNDAYWSAPIAGTPVATQVCDASGTVCAFTAIAEFSAMASQDGSVMVFCAGASISTNPDRISAGEWYSVFNAGPTRYTPISGFATLGFSHAMILPADSVSHGYIGQFGCANLSPDGSLLAFVSRNTKNNATEAEEVYVAATNGIDAGSTLFGNPITTDDRVNTTLNTNLKHAHDLFMTDNDQLYFWYGQRASGNRTTDLFHHTISTDSFANLTKTADATLGIIGNVYPEGLFPSPNGVYFYFSRGLATSANQANLAGVRAGTDTIFNVTGSEFPGSGTTTTSNIGGFGQNFGFHTTMAGGDQGTLTYFATAPLSSTTTQVWVFDPDFPFAAIQVTRFTASNLNVESLTPNPFATGVGFALTAPTTDSADVWYVDLLRGLRDDITESGLTKNFALNSIRFVPPADADDSTGAMPPAIVFGVGSLLVDNPNDAGLFWAPINGTATSGGTAIAGLPSSGVLQVYHASIN